MAFLNTSKAKNILKSAGINAEDIVKGNNADVKIDWKQKLPDFIEYGGSKLLNALDYAGTLLKESHLTRSTSIKHKKNDFSSIQAVSSLNLQQFYKDIQETTYEKIFDADGKSAVELDKKTKKQVDDLGKQLTKSLNIALRVIKRNPALLKELQQSLAGINSNSAIINKLNNYLPKNLEISENATKTGARHFINKTTAIGGGSAGIVLSAASFVLSAASFTAISCATLTTVTVATLGTALVVEVPIVAGLLIATLVVCGDKERFGAIAAKKELIKIDDEFTKAIRCLNKAAYLVKQNTVNSEEKYEKESDEKNKKLYEAKKGIINKFLTDQKTLWNPYTTAEGREYTRAEDKTASGTHKTGLITVSNEKSSTLGKMKQGIAKTWVELAKTGNN